MTTSHNISVTPSDIAFSANSSMKIPIMVTAFLHYNSKISDELDAEITKMINLSQLEASDAVMAAIDKIRGPLVVTETMKKLGLDNTFIAMFYAAGSVPLDRITTVANSRVDINTDPDDFNQSTPSEMGMLLEDVYQCSQNGGGSLVAAFPGQIDQAACQRMIQYLEKDKLGALIQGGVPEGTIVAHKHGWDNFENQFSDVAIVYTPGGNFILTIYSSNPVQFQWDITSRMYAEISRAIYNYFNLPSQ